MIIPRPLHTCLSALMVVCAMTISTSAPAQGPGTTTVTDEEIETLLVRWNFQLDLIDDELKKENLDEAVLSALQSQAESMQADMTGVRDQARLKLKNVRKLLDALGPTPAVDQPPEEATVSQRRLELEAEAEGLFRIAFFSQGFGE